jgi:hypothetical protein
MKIAVMAAGGVGGYLAALRDKGLTLNSATGAQKVRGRPL